MAKALKNKKVVISGAGIAGLGLSIALAQQGADVTIYEQNPPLQDMGAGIQITPNGFAVLRAWGLAKAAQEKALPTHKLSVISAKNGAVLSASTLGDDAGGSASGRYLAPERYLLFHRAELIALLAQTAQAAGVEVVFDRRLDGYNLKAAAPNWRDSEGNQGHADCVIGADGLYSTLAAQLNPKRPETPVFSGQVAWRGVIEDPQLSQDPAQRAGNVEIYMGGGRHFVSYPMGDGLLRNIVAVEERPNWVFPEHNFVDDSGAFQQAFADFPARVQEWVAQVKAPVMWGLFLYPVAERWYHIFPQGGAAIILGDAAHSTLPFLAQGANMALEDAFTLGSAIAAQPYVPLEVSLARWSQYRRARCRQIVKASKKNAHLYHLSGLAGAVLHNGLKLVSKVSPNVLMHRYSWIYQHDVTLTGFDGTGNAQRG